MRRFVDHYERFKDEPHVRQVFSDLGAFQYEMDVAGITDHQLVHTQNNSRLWRRLFRHLVLCFCYLPLALPGFILHFPILALAVFTGEGLSPRKDVIATTKMMSATFLVLMAYLLLPCIPLVFWPWPLGLYTALYLFVFLPTNRMVHGTCFGTPSLLSKRFRRLV